MTLPTLVLNTEAIRDLQLRLDELEREVKQIRDELTRIRKFSGGGGMAEHGNEWHDPTFHPTNSDLLPATDGLFLGETTTPRRWDGSKLINLSGSQISDVLLLDGSRAMTGDLKPQTTGTLSLGTEAKYWGLAYVSDARLTKSYIGLLYNSVRAYTDTILEYTTATGVTIDGLLIKDSQPYCDVVNEKTSAAGVTVDGVRCKDAQIEMADTKKITWLTSNPNYPYITSYAEASLKFWAYQDINFDGSDIFFDAARFHFQPTVNVKFVKYPELPVLCETDVYWQVYDDGLGAYTEVARFKRGSNASRFDISKAGDISIVNDRFIQIGKDSDGSLPEADATYRGKMIRVEDAAGDSLYICEWNGSVYAWRQI